MMYLFRWSLEIWGNHSNGFIRCALSCVNLKRISPSMRTHHRRMLAWYLAPPLQRAWNFLYFLTDAKRLTCPMSQLLYLQRIIQILAILNLSPKWVPTLWERAMEAVLYQI